MDLERLCSSGLSFSYPWLAYFNSNATFGDTPVYTADGASYTIVSIVPEPATIALLGLGSLLMVRRNRKK